MPKDEDDHDENFPFNHPERGGNFAAVIAAPLSFPTYFPNEPPCFPMWFQCVVRCYSCRLGAHSHCYHCLDPIPPTEGGA